MDELSSQLKELRSICDLFSIHVDLHNQHRFLGSIPVFIDHTENKAERNLRFNVSDPDCLDDMIGEDTCVLIKATYKTRAPSGEVREVISYHHDLSVAVQRILDHHKRMATS